jgi:hypothetical protein
VQNTTPTAARRYAPWDLDSLDSGSLHREFSDLALFVDWLRACDVTVPSCWYTHGWVVRRLAALRVWHDDAHLDGASGRDAADWWRAGVMPLCADWRDLIAHRGRHVPSDAPLADPQPVPPLDEWIANVEVGA